MRKKYQQNQSDKIKNQFREHPYYKLCKTVFRVFQDSHPTMVMTPELLFEDASLTIDRILQEGDFLTEQCQDLWTNIYNQYRNRDGIGGDKNDTMSEVAMLFYTLMFCLQSVKHSHYRGILQRTLHESIRKCYGQKNCMDMEAKLREPVNLHTVEMLTWMDEYFKSTQSLTKEIENVLHPQKPKKTQKHSKEEDKTPYVLKYICSDEKTRTNRLQRVMMLMQEWKWIAEPKNADDFFDFFNGENRACNLLWIGKPKTILTLLIQSLNKQPYFEKQTGASESAIIKNQFGLKTVNYNFERVSSKDRNCIELILAVLNPAIQFKKLPSRGEGDGFDYSIATMNEVYQNDLHVTKDLNKLYE